MEDIRSSILQMAKGAIQERGEIGVYPADGGVWKLEATRNIAGYFEEALKDLIESGSVVVIR